MSANSCAAPGQHTKGSRRPVRQRSRQPLRLPPGSATATPSAAIVWSAAAGLLKFRNGGFVRWLGGGCTYRAKALLTDQFKVSASNVSGEKSKPLSEQSHPCGTSLLAPGADQLADDHPWPRFHPCTQGADNTWHCITIAMRLRVASIEVGPARLMSCSFRRDGAESASHGPDRRGVGGKLIAPSKGRRRGVTDPDPVAGVLPHQHLDRQAQAGELIHLHDAGSQQGVAEDDQDGRAQLEADLSRGVAVVDYGPMPRSIRLDAPGSLSASTQMQSTISAKLLNAQRSRRSTCFRSSGSDSVRAREPRSRPDASGPRERLP